MRIGSVSEALKNNYIYIYISGLWQMLLFRVTYRSGLLSTWKTNPYARAGWSEYKDNNVLKRCQMQDWALRHMQINMQLINAFLWLGAWLVITEEMDLQYAVTMLIDSVVLTFRYTRGKGRENPLGLCQQDTPFTYDSSA